MGNKDSKDLKTEEIESGSGLTRRDFLKGAAVGAVGVAVTGALASCENPTTETKWLDKPLDADEAGKKWAFEIPPAPISDSEIGENVVNHEYVVIGSGISGLCAAVALAEEGADVIVVSAGNLAQSRGGSNQAINSSYQRELLTRANNGEDELIKDGERDPWPNPYTPQHALEHVKLEQLAGIYAMDKIKWSRWLENSGISMDWMIAKMRDKGLNVNLEPPYTDADGTLAAPPSVHNFYNSNTTWGMGVFYGAPQCAEAYARWLIDDYDCEIHYRTKALQLVRADNGTGRVSAVICERIPLTGTANPDDSSPYPDGAKIKYTASKGIILATGDFSQDRDMMAKYSPWVYETCKNFLNFTGPQYDAGLQMGGLMDGQGQKMGLWAGAAWQRVNPNPCAINGGTSGPTHAVVDNFWGINLNINGKRFHNENTNFAFGAISKLQQPQQTSFGVWSASYADTEKEWETLGCHYLNDPPQLAADSGVVFSRPQTPAQLKASWLPPDPSNPYAYGGSTPAADATPDSTQITADSLDDLLTAAQRIWGINKTNALASIRRYDDFAAAGQDDEFQVNPKLLHVIEDGGPYYMTRSVGASFLCVMGGLRTNEYLQVCDADDKPLPGLYNTGTMIGDFFAGTYNFGLPGQNLGACCLTLSWLLGKDLALDRIPDNV
jgi:hypothetical protein